MPNEKVQSTVLSQTTLDTLVSVSPGMVFTKGTSGTFISCNQAFVDFLGLDQSEIIGKTDLDIFPQRELDDSHCLNFATLITFHSDEGSRWLTLPDGKRVLVKINTVPFAIENADKSGVLCFLHEVTQSGAESALNAQKYDAIVQSNKDGFWLVDEQGYIREVNDAYCEYSGYSKDEILNMPISKFEAAETKAQTREHIQKIMQQGSDLFETTHFKKDGSYWPVEVAANYSKLNGGCFFSYIRDITERKVSNELIRLRSKLSEMVYQDDINLILREALDTAEKLTFSKIGFFHFVEDDEETISLQAWSTRTLREMCYAKSDAAHYPVSKAGVWVDCIHQKKSVIHNDYAALEHKKGMPEGHPHLERELTVPLFRNGKIVSVIGLGNKETEYTDKDIEVVEQIAGLCFEFSERKRAEEQIQFMAYNDVLTKLPNRVLLADRLQQSISRSKRSGESLAICYLDLDDFKFANDHFGHDVGDKLLINFAGRLLSELREDDTLARIGGDEFALLLNGLHNISEAQETAQRLLEAASIPFEIDGHRIHVSASIGITCFPYDESDADTLLRNADKAMYQSKDRGKNTFSLFEPVKNIMQLEKEQFLSEFNTALKQNQLVLYYQPRMDIQSGEFVGVEALIRWQHPKNGLLQPGQFLPLIADTPLEIHLDEWVLMSALDQHLLWLKQGLEIPVSVNITPRHIQQSSFAGYLKHTLEQYPEGTARLLELEVLETGSFNDVSTVSQTMTECIKLGVHFSLDDFGTGYSSLSYFHKLPINILKIDQNFVRRMLSNEADQQIVEGVIRLADSTNNPVVAEGVENIELGYMLHQLGCRFAQGYGIAKPMPADELAEWSLQRKYEKFWQIIQDEASMLTSHYDLNVAIFTTKKWISHFKSSLSGIQKGIPDTIDTGSNHFTDWYHGIGQSKYGDKPQFPFILAKHNLMSDLATTLHEKALGQPLSDEDWSQLENAVTQLIEMLIELD
jgi:diguanylate cyclase (GGDEF)-like protein/PAS domain S-box-containing protein